MFIEGEGDKDIIKLQNEQFFKLILNQSKYLKEG